MSLRIARLAALLLLVAACSKPAPSGSPAQYRNTLSAEEMLRAGYPDAFTTVQSLRPAWLQRRGATSLRGGTSIKVYMDGSLLGGIEQMRQVMTRSISSIRYLDGLEASERWGLDHGQGAIVVTTRR